MLVVVVFLAVPWILTSGPVVRYGLSEAGEHLQAPLTLEDVDFGWFDGLTVRGVRLGEPEGFGDEPAMELREMHADVSLGALLGGTLDAEVTLIEPVLRVRRDEQGALNWDRILGREPATPSPEERPRVPPEERRRSGGAGGGEDLPRIRLFLRDGSVFLTDARAGLNEALTGIQVRLAPGAGGFELEVRAVLQSGGDPRPTGRIEATAQFDPADPASAHARLLCQGLDLGRYEALLPVLNVPLDRMRGTIEGELEAAGTAPQVLQVKGELHVRDLELAGPALEPRRVSVARGVLRPDCTIDLARGIIDTEHVLADLGFLKLQGLPAAASARLLAAAGAASPLGFSVQADLDALAQQPGWLPESVRTLGGNLKVDLAASNPWNFQSSEVQPLQWVCEGGIEGLRLAASFLPEGVELPPVLSLRSSGSVDPAAGTLEVPDLGLALGETRLDARASLGGGSRGGLDLEVAPDLVQSVLHAFAPAALETQGPAALHVTFEVPETAAQDAGLLQATAATGSLSVPSLAFLENLLSGLQFQFQLAAGRVALETAEGGVLNGGPLRLAAGYQLAGAEQSHFELDLGWKDGRAGGSLTPLLRYCVPLLAGLSSSGLDDLTRIDLETGMDFNVAVAGQSHPREGQSWLDVLSGWAGNGSLRLTQGSFTPAPAVGELLRYLDSRDRLTFSQLTSKFTIEEGAVQGPDIEVRRKGTPLALSGFTRFDGALDYDLDLTELLRSHKSGAKILEALGSQQITAGLTGTLTDPRLDLGLLSGQSLDDFVEGVLDGLQGDPQGTVENLLDLFGKKKKDGRDD